MNLFQGLLSKIGAESLLSLYPTFVKNINLSLGIQLWSRFFIYVLLSLFFIDYDYIAKHVFSHNGIMLMLVTLVHVFTSYQGFLLLEGGIAYAIFYTYPLMILFLSGEKAVPWYLFLSLIGVYILANKPHKQEQADKQKTKPEQWFPIKKEYEGTLMIILAAITEAWIFFIIRNLPTKNNWNHMFLSYIIGAIFYTAYYFKDLLKMSHLTGRLTLSLVVNAIIGLFGYLLRFYSIANLPAYIYAPLSYLGIIMAYIYGVLINGDSITMSDIGGTLMILVPNLIMVHG